MVKVEASVVGHQNPGITEEESLAHRNAHSSRPGPRLCTFVSWLYLVDYTQYIGGP